MSDEKRIEWLITIVDHEKGQQVAEIIHEYKVGFHLIFKGRGTANSEIMDYFGLDQPEKEIVASLIPQNMIHEVMHKIANSMKFHKPGSGIAFSIPLSGICVSSLKKIGGGELKMEYSKEQAIQKTEKNFELIISVVNFNHVDDLMEVAKNAGAKGGTIMKAREVFSEEVTKIFGITIQPEREILLILVPKEDKQAILKAISSHLSFKDDKHGIAFSLPVSDVVGQIKR